MSLVTATKRIVPGETRKPGTFALSLLEMDLPLTVPVKPLVRESITTNRAPSLPARTSVLAQNWTVHAVLRVPATRLHQGRDEAPHGLQIDRLSFLIITEHRIQQGSQTCALWTFYIHRRNTRSRVNITAAARHTHLQIVRLNFLVPCVPCATVR